MVGKMVPTKFEMRNFYNSKVSQTWWVPFVYILSSGTEVTGDLPHRDFPSHFHAARLLLELGGAKPDNGLLPNRGGGAGVRFLVYRGKGHVALVLF